MLDSHRILSPSADGEVRIPALVRHNGILYCFFDQRPRPPHGVGSDFNGEVMASDLPNPNRLAYLLRGAAGQWSSPRTLQGGPAVSSDACVASSQGRMTVAYASVSGPVSYISSTRHGPRLEPWVASGPSPEKLVHRRLDELYVHWEADALFATSGSTITWEGAALVPYVVRQGERTHIRIAHVVGTDVRVCSEPIAHPELNLDETSLSIYRGRIVLNARVQGFEGRGAGRRCWATSEDGLHFSPVQVRELEDPGCNGTQLGPWLLHPRDNQQRRAGVLSNMIDGSTIPLTTGSFGYSDALRVDERLLVVFESDDCLAELYTPPLAEWE
ncbi:MULTISPECIES: sialidase family protein [Corynebacterium]|uniref:sialidase family protein n=1 Tax=Corynebacterium TaxID=1716 RepID=UPI00124DC1F4|nr:MULTISPECIES: sialidase family protein [Corynebacterium]